MDGQAKVSLILELKNRLSTGMSRAKQSLKTDIGEMKHQMDGLRSKWSGHWQNMKNDLPGVGGALGLLSNPLTAIAAGVAFIGVKWRQASEEAAKFAAGWREVAMLNIDKPVREMNKLKSMVYDTAFNKGFDATGTAKAFFDIQSVTGKFGREVDLIVKKQGEFANLMQADFNSWIAGSGKAMANYGFGAERLDEFNRAAFATVKTGVTTFDELSKVMSVYAGSASSAKQDFDAAQKIFSLFTVKVKSVDEAATLTKSLFNDLTKETTIKAFEKIGIKMYDNNGKFRQADSILLDLNKKFKALGDDRSIMSLKNQFQGSEGLIAYIQTAMDKTGQLQTTLSTFDATELGMNKALKIARNDINYINQQLENRTKTLMAEIGAGLLPIKNFFLEGINNFVTRGRDYFTGTDKLVDRYRASGESDMLAKYPGLANPTSLNDNEFQALLRKVEIEKKVQEESIANTTKYKENYNRLLNKTSFFNYQYSTGAWFALKEMTAEAIAKRNNPFSEPLAPATGNGNSTTGTPGSDTITKITGAAQPVRNQTINIDAFVKGGINTQHTNLQQMDERQLEAWFKNMFLRVMANMETSFQ